MRRERAYVMLHTTQQVQAHVNTSSTTASTWTRWTPEPAESLEMNDIGRVSVSTGRAIHCDAYSINAPMGGFVLVDPQSNVTVAAGMIRPAGDLGRVHGRPHLRQRALVRLEHSAR